MRKYTLMCGCDEVLFAGETQIIAVNPSCVIHSIINSYRHPDFRVPINKSNQRDNSKKEAGA
jgi:hypothetical protein